MSPSADIAIVCCTDISLWLTTRWRRHAIQQFGFQKYARLICTSLIVGAFQILAHAKLKEQAMFRRATQASDSQNLKLNHFENHSIFGHYLDCHSAFISLIVLKNLRNKYIHFCLNQHQQSFSKLIFQLAPVLIPS